MRSFFKNNNFQGPALDSFGKKFLYETRRVFRRSVRRKLISQSLVVTLLITGLVGGQFLSLLVTPKTAYAATYTFTQTDWSGGATANTAAHPTNETGWNQYSNKDSSITIANGGADLQLATSAGSTSQTTDTDFNAGTNSNTAILGTGSDAGINLLSSGTDPYWSNVVFLSHFDGSNGSTALTDEAGHTVLVANGGALSTAQKKFGTASLLESTGSPFTSTSTDYAIASGQDFTTEGQAYYTGAGFQANLVIFDGGQTGTDTLIVTLDNNAAGGRIRVDLVSYNSQTIVFSNFGSIVNTNEWFHWAVTRQSNNVKLFINGVQRGDTAVNSSALIGSSGNIRGGLAPSGDYWDGYFDEIRLTKGVARYATNFTPPSAAFPNIPSPLSGTFTSSVIDIGQASAFTTLGFTKTTPAGTTLTVDARAGNTATPDGTWTSWQTNISNGGSISGLAGNRYVQYRANLATTDSTATPTLSDITFNYNSYSGGPVTATGGTITTSGDYTIHTFTSSGTFTVTAGGNVDYLVVGGGGGGGHFGGGGGGAGGVRTNTGYSVTNQSYTVTVGTGGNGGAGSSGNVGTVGSNGGDSIFGSITATGGGGGGSYSNITANSNGANGGSGGGGGTFATGQPGGTGTSGQGSNGGTGGTDNATWRNGAGGGGASAAGASVASVSSGGNGGAGVSNSYSGAAVVYGGGGGGGSADNNNNGVGGTGGSGGGGNGGKNPATLPTGGTANTGGGGGGGNLTNNNGDGAPGGSGIVIIRYPTSFTPYLISSPYNTGSASNILSKISWSKTTPAGTTVKFQVRTSPDNSTWTSWMGPGGTSSTYFTDSTGGETMPAALRDGSGDRWIQYQVFLTNTDTSVTPTLSDVTMTYVVNAPPDFDATFGTDGVSAVENATTTDATYGKVDIRYKVRDSDTLSGTVNQGYVTPSFEYNIGGGWVVISSQYLAAGDTSNKAVEQTNYTTHSATWDAKSQIPNTYTASAQIRVTANDNEGASNTATATGGNFTLDTRSPVVTVGMDVSAGTVSLSATDNSNILDYAISNSSDLSGATSGSGTTTTFGVTPAWTFSAATSSVSVYTRIRDIYGNTSSTTIVGPIAPATTNIRDVSNVITGDYREFVTWDVYPSPNPSGATFQKYELYRSTNGSSYSLLTSITGQSTNYYIDASVASTTTYYYKTRYVDTDDDIGNYGSVVNDQPNGQGGTDVTAPTISSVTVANIKNTSAQVTWTTDELANSQVDYGTTNAYGSSATDSAYVTSSHSVYITGLTPNTTYYLRVKSTDISSNIGTDDNGGSGYSFTTSGGPVITNVTVSDLSDVSATVFWNTSTAADSYVNYSLSSNLSSYQTAGTATLVSATAAPFQHKVTLTGLSAGTTYYFQVKSTDADTNTTIDTNSGSYYSFRTTLDTTTPVISSVSAPVRAYDAAVISWQTDELSTSQVEYGTTASTTSGSYSATTVTNSTPSIFHVVTLSSETNKTGGGTNTLTKKTAYYYRVKSADQAGNMATSDEYTFTTNEDGSVVIQVSGGGGGGAASDQTPPIISGVKVESVSAFGAIISFSTNEQARGAVNYGEMAVSGANTSETSWSSAHSITLKGLKMGTKYVFNVSAVDKFGNEAYSPEQTFKTNILAENLGDLTVLETNTSDEIQNKIENLIESALPSINPPFIETPSVENVTEDGATITWKTNIKTYGSVSYAPGENYKDGQYIAEVSETDAKLAIHEIELANLKPNTVYHYSVKSYVFPQVPAKTSDLTFITKAAKVQAQILDLRNDSFRVVWTSDEPTSSVVEYNREGSSSINKKTDGTMAVHHDVKIENLSPGTTYTVNAYGYTVAQNLVGAKENLTVTTSRDVTPPKIASFKVDSALVPGRTDRTQTVISWSTDEPATSVIYYEEGSGSPDQPLSNKQEDVATFTENHAVILTTLKPGAVYRLQVSSTDEAGNAITLPVRTIVTPRENQSIVDVIFKNFSDTFNFINNIR